MRIIGVDICKNSVAVCLLEQKPQVPREFYYECNFYRFTSNSVGVTGLLSLKPDVAVMEPTGVNYSKLWVEVLSRSGCEVRFVDHKKLRSYRANHLDLPDKDDDADSLAMACYYFDYCDIPNRFLKIRDPLVVRIKESILRLNHLNRLRSPIINRLRQDLAWQFPEVMNTRSVRCSDDVPLLWGWIAGERESKKYDHAYQNSIGLGLTDSAKFHASRLCDLEREEMEIEAVLLEALTNPKFTHYREVFRRFKFGPRLEAIILTQVYPIESYLGEDGNPEVVIRRGRKSGNPTKRHLSLRKFQKSLGAAPSQESSGDVSKSKVSAGSALARRALWQWVFTSVEVSRCRTTPILEELGELLDAEKLAGRPVKLARSRIAVKAVKLLFRELVKNEQSTN